MTETVSQLAMRKPQRRWYQCGRRTALAATAVLALFAGLAVHFRSHLLLRFLMARGSMADVEAIPVFPMPEPTEPKGWVHCHVGSLQFDLPSEMAGNVVTPKNGAPIRGFHHGSKSVVVHLPEHTNYVDEFLADVKLPPQGQGLSLPRLRAACYQASSADFRWTMSQDELRWHAWCIAMSGFLRLNSDGWAETIFRADLDGIVLFDRELRHTMFEWQATNKAVGAFIHFQDSSTDLDPEWVRCVCRSVRFVEEPHPGGQTSEEKLSPLRSQTKWRE